VHRLRVAALVILPAIAVLAASDLAVRHWYSRSVFRLLFDILGSRGAEEQIVFRKPLARFDAVAGYTCIPGVHIVSLVKGRVRIDSRITIGGDGYRIAGQASGSTRNPGLWIFGCSYTWGLGVNDDETFPWIVQRAMPAFQVRNLGGNGYGNLQALLQMRDAVRNRIPLPRIAVLVYNDFDLARNVASPSYLRMMNASGQSFERPRASVPAGSVDDSGGLRIGWIPLFQPPTGNAAAEESPEPDLEYQIRVTQALLDSFYEICRQNGIAAVLAVQSRPSGDPMVEYARRAGYVLADIFVDLDERGGWRYRLQPVDGHPNRAAHAQYAARLLDTLRALPGPPSPGAAPIGCCPGTRERRN